MYKITTSNGANESAMFSHIFDLVKFVPYMPQKIYKSVEKGSDFHSSGLACTPSHNSHRACIEQFPFLLSCNHQRGVIRLEKPRYMPKPSIHASSKNE